MSVSALKKRTIEVELKLNGSTFSGGGTAKSYSGAAIDCRIRKRGLPSLNECEVDIANIKQADIETITTTSALNLELQRNEITVKAGNLGEQLSVVFQGEIFLAYGTYESADLGVHIEAMTGVFPKLKSDPPFTHEGRYSGTKLIQQYTEEMNYTFENNGFKDVQLTDMVVNGSPLDKIIQVAEHMKAQVICDDYKIILSPPEKGIGDAINVAPPPKGNMLGYPFFSANGVNFNNLWSPKFRQGGYINITETMVPRAKGLWKIILLNHHLQCHGAGDAWQTYIEGIYPDVS